MSMKAFYTLLPSLNHDSSFLAPGHRVGPIDRDQMAVACFNLARNHGMNRRLSAIPEQQNTGERAIVWIFGNPFSNHALVDHAMG